MNDADAPVTHRMGDPLLRSYVDPPPAQTFAQTWRYTESDPALMLFTAAVTRFGMTFPDGSRVLELGCSESDWLERMARLNRGYDMVGVDANLEGWRSEAGFTLRPGSAMDPRLFEPNSFDRIVLLGALEHFGLGFYGDPVHEDGDSHAMANIANWLRPGGFVYFDVPVQPAFRIPDNRHFRMYAADDAQPGSVADRLLTPLVRARGLHEVNRAYSLPEPTCGTWCHQPTSFRNPYWFVAVLAEKTA